MLRRQDRSRRGSSSIGIIVLKAVITLFAIVGIKSVVNGIERMAQKPGVNERANQTRPPAHTPGVEIIDAEKEFDPGRVYKVLRVASFPKYNTAYAVVWNEWSNSTLTTPIPQVTSLESGTYFRVEFDPAGNMSVIIQKGGMVVSEKEGGNIGNNP